MKKKWCDYKTLLWLWFVACYLIIKKAVPRYFRLLYGHLYWGVRKIGFCFPQSVEKCGNAETLDKFCSASAQKINPVQSSTGFTNERTLIFNFFVCNFEGSCLNFDCQVFDANSPPNKDIVFSFQVFRLLLPFNYSISTYSRLKHQTLYTTSLKKPFQTNL